MLVVFIYCPFLSTVNRMPLICFSANLCYFTLYCVPDRIWLLPKPIFCDGWEKWIGFMSKAVQKHIIKGIINCNKKDTSAIVRLSVGSARPQKMTFIHRLVWSQSLLKNIILSIKNLICKKFSWFGAFFGEKKSLTDAFQVNSYVSSYVFHD